MMDALRSSAGSWIAKIFIALLAMSFGIWGIADVFRGHTTDVLARVGSEKITGQEYRRALDRQIRAFSERQGVQITAEQAKSIGLDRQVLAQLLQGASLDAQASSLGLAISDAMIAERIAANKAFQGPDGQFDPNRFRQILERNGLSEGEVVRLEKENLLAGGIVDALTSGTAIPKTMAQIAWRHGNEQRDAKYFVISSEKIVVPAPSDSDLKSFYDSHPESFSVPERRTVAMVAVTPDSVAPSITVKDDELAKEYDKRKQKYAIPERRRIERIPFPTLEEAQKAHTRIMGGTPFATVATDRGFTDKDTVLDKVSKEEMRDPAVADVAFALKDGEVSQPVQGRLSVFLVKASNIEPGRERSFDEVKDTLRNELQLERARDVIIDLHGKIEDGRGGGATLEEVARENKLPLKVFGPMDRNGTGLDGKDVPDMPVKSELLKAAFESDVGVDNEPLSTSDDGFIWYEVREVKPAQRKPFEVAKPEVAQAWTDRQRREKLTEAAKGLVKRAEQGTKLEDLAREQASEVKTQNGIKRGQSSEAFDTAAVAALFAVPENGFASALEGDGKHAKIMQSTPVMTQPFDASSADVRKITELLSESLSTDISSLYLAELQHDLGVSLNDALWQQVNGQSG
jgi:peptidyl-prolyl cis-trans isomerase D